MKPILLVDDSKTVLLYMTSALQKQGYEVVAVEDGESALEVLTHRKDIQFVLSDLMMPGLSGIDLCRLLKSAAFERYIFLSCFLHAMIRARLLKALTLARMIS
ncbi:response regulator [Vibrio parahaemolyticus]|nr:response regulator [Vibrio parahaemolyticus]